MSLRAIHESRQNSLQSKQNKTEPVLSLEQEDLLKRLAEVKAELSTERQKREKAEAETQQLLTALQTQTEVMTQLCESSDSEMPTKLNEKLKEQEQERLLLQEQNRQLKKQLQDAAATAEDDRTAHKKEKSRLETRISDLEKLLEYRRFDKEQYLKGLESREQAVEEDRANLEALIRARAEEIEQEAVDQYKAKETACEAEKARYIELQHSEKEKIDTEVTRQVTEHKAELDKQTAQERAEQERQHNEREKALEKHWISRNGELIAKYATISGVTVIGGLISAITAVCSVVIAFTHGLLPFIIEDGKEIGGWISNDWHLIFGQAFVFPQSLLPILQLALPLIFLIVVGIWTALDFDERKWVVFADTVSCIFIGTSIGISAVFGKQLSSIGLNTVMFPIAVYLLYVLIRWLWEIEAIQGLFEGIKWLISAPIKRWSGLDSNEKVGNGIIAVVVIGGILAVWYWLKG